MVIVAIVAIVTSMAWIWGSIMGTPLLTGHRSHRQFTVSINHAPYNGSPCLHQTTPIPTPAFYGKGDSDNNLMGVVVRCERCAFVVNGSFQKGN